MNSVAASRTTIADALIPGSGVLRDTMLVTGGAVFTAVGAQVSIPLQPVPLTFQTMSVMLCGLALGAKRGGLSLLVYLGAGVAGAPIFAGGAAGPVWVFGKTGGYLISFAVVAAVLGWLAETGWTRSIPKTAAAMAIGIALNLGMGAIWLSGFIGGQAAFQFGVVPFLVVEAMKAAVVIIILPSVWKSLSGRQPTARTPDRM